MAALPSATQDMMREHRQLLLVKCYSWLLDTKLTVTSDFFSIVSTTHPKRIRHQYNKIIIIFRMKKSQDEIKDDAQN